jgi:hypothetical protein
MADSTVLVLGAGASAPYGFPSGHALLLNVLNDLPSSLSKLAKGRADVVRDILMERQIEERLVYEFLQRLSKSGQPSVDLFLERNPEYVDIGRLATVLSLMPCEKETDLTDINILSTENGKRWYWHLFQQLDARAGEFPSGDVSIITFNYDRSLEQYLFVALKNSYNLTDSECLRKLSSLPVLHVHGSFGSLPWRRPRDQAAMPYGEELDPQLCWKVADEIKIPSDASRSSPVFEEARDRISTARRVYFLGFGCHDDNLRRLGVREIWETRREIWKHKEDTGPAPPFKDTLQFMGTGWKLGAARAQTVSAQWNIEFPALEADTLEFLRDHVSF